MGFGATPVVASVLAEGVLIGLLGGGIGAIVSYLAFNGVRASTINFSSFSQVSFAFTVTPALLIQAISYAIALGLIGGLLPSLRAARLPIATGLREL
jgi:putative ABC transport system permease protein